MVRQWQCLVNDHCHTNVAGLLSSLFLDDPCHSWWTTPALLSHHIYFENICQLAASEAKSGFIVWRSGHKWREATRQGDSTQCESTQCDSTQHDLMHDITGCDPVGCDLTGCDSTSCDLTYDSMWYDPTLHNLMHNPTGCDSTGCD